MEEIVQDLEKKWQQVQDNALKQQTPGTLSNNHVPSGTMSNNRVPSMLQVFKILTSSEPVTQY